MNDEGFKSVQKPNGALLQISINRQAPTPLYLQFKNHILEQINNEYLLEDDLLPTEQEYQLATGLSRATIRQALNALEQEGYIIRNRRLGTKVVRTRISSHGMKLVGFSEEIIARGMTPGSKIINIDFEVPPAKVTKFLDNNQKDKMWHIRRVRLANDIPYALHDLYIPPTLGIAPVDLQNMTSFYYILREKVKMPPLYARETLRAISADKNEAELLNIVKGSPVLEIWRVAYSHNDVLVEIARILQDADRYEYKLEMYV